MFNEYNIPSHNLKCSLSFPSFLSPQKKSQIQENPKVKMIGIGYFPDTALTYEEITPRGILELQDVVVSHTPVAYTCKTSYSGGRDQEDRSSKSAWANSAQDPILKNPSQK
jgi:hypothetical protein